MQLRNNELKIYLSSYRNHWISPYLVLEKVFFWREIDYDEPIITKLGVILTPFFEGLELVLDIIHPKINYVKIDKWDTWSMDNTLAKIILPMLKQLKATKHGSPHVADEDVPEGLNLRSVEAPPKINDWDSDDNLHRRWDWVLDEMIWSFEQLTSDWDVQYFISKGPNNFDSVGYTKHDTRINNGLILFGKYYRNLWD